MEIERGLVMVIHEMDLSDRERIVIGVATNRKEALEIIREYYGKEAVFSEFRDIRNDNLDFDVKVSVDGNKYYVWGEDFTINSI